MSISPVIDQQYRLLPRELGRYDRVVTILNVSGQGLERVAPLLHLREFPNKRLLLDPIQQQEIQEITGALQWEEWIGHTLMIAARSDRDQLRIHFYPAPAQTTAQTKGTSLVQIPDSMRATLLLLLVLMLIFLAVMLLDR